MVSYPFVSLTLFYFPPSFIPWSYSQRVVWRLGGLNDIKLCLKRRSWEKKTSSFAYKRDIKTKSSSEVYHRKDGCWVGISFCVMCCAMHPSMATIGFNGSLRSTVLVARDEMRVWCIYFNGFLSRFYSVLGDHLWFLFLFAIEWVSGVVILQSVYGFFHFISIF